MNGEKAAQTRIYRCRGIVGGIGEGPALMADTRLSFWGGFDPVAGRIVEVGNPLEGDPFLAIKIGDWVKVDADRGIVEVTSNS